MNALKRSFRRKPRAARDGDVVKTLIETFQYPRKGPGMMWEAAAAQDYGARRPDPDGPRAGRARL